jgi:hypothetical protein
MKRERYRSQQRGTTNDPQDGELLHSLTVSGSVAPAAVSVKMTALNLRTVSCFCSFWTLPATNTLDKNELPTRTILYINGRGMT